MKKIIIISAVIAVSVASYLLYSRNTVTEQSTGTYKTYTAGIGSIENTISATGTIEPVSQVEVGTQVSGIVKKVYIDFNDQVKKGQLIAEIDKTNLLTSLKNEEISLHSAESNYTYQKNCYDREKKLYDNKFSSDSDLEAAEYSLENAEINLEKAKLAYNKAEQDLEYASIYSPIDGIVLSVSIEEGQTVVASFSSPTLFTIVNDLTKMTVEAKIDEADIGSVNVGQEVEFTVDAYPDDIFHGSVIQKRIEPSESSNVVTYTVLIDTDNEEMKLLPGMTASLDIFTMRKDNVLMIPEKALNFIPADYHENRKISENEHIIWKRSGTGIEPVRIITGAGNGSDIEVLDGLIAGDEVILSSSGTGMQNSVASAAVSGGSSKSPFMPTSPGRH